MNFHIGSEAEHMVQDERQDPLQLLEMLTLDS